MKKALSYSLATLATAGALLGAFTVGSLTSDPTPREVKQCETWGYMTDGECFAAGSIRFGVLPNITAAGQFCKWQNANRGEWSRLQAYAADRDAPAQVVTWFGAGLRNVIQAYHATGAPEFALVEYRPANRCRTPLAPPTVTSVTPGQTDVTVEIEPGG